MMHSEVTIAPSILAADFTRLGEEVREVEAAGADWIHVDVMDGHFVPNITMGPVVVAALRRATGLPLDVHLMIEQPERYLEAFAQAGADHLIVHVENAPHLHRTLQQIRALGPRAGVAINPATPLGALDEVLGLVDHVLVMTVNPGFGGQAFIPSSPRRVRALAERLTAAGSKARIAVDGGIDPQTAPQIVAAGARVLVAGSAIFGGPPGQAGAALAALRAALRAALGTALASRDKPRPD
jgi:ribulose-phosphate 3-epimerase